MKKLFLLIYICLIVANSFAQNNLGMNFDDEEYKKTSLKAKLVTRDYTIIPKQASLKEYCPIPKNQGQYGTCVGWSTAYAARTILEAKANGWADKEQITSNAFSAGFVYKQIKSPDDEGCKYGTFINDALDVMMSKGVAKYTDFYESCPGEISSEVFQKATPYKIKDYARLFEEAETKSFKIQSVKKALASGNPVVIGMKCPNSFQNAVEYWQPASDEDPSYKYGGHAMCVIGYDNDMYGGAFEIQNSWGTYWGNEGYIWIKYDDFADYTKYAFEVIAIPKSSNTNADLSGNIKFTQSSGQDMSATFVANRDGIGYYKSNSSYPSGTRFRLYISNNEPAYVYAIGSDLTNEVFTIFPYSENISAALNYTSNNVALPDEEHYVQTDKTVGKDFLCVLYCKEALDIESIKSSIKQQSGTFSERVSKVLTGKLVTQGATFSPSEIKFQATSGDKSVIAIIVETDHIE